MKYIADIFLICRFIINVSFNFSIVIDQKGV